MFIAIQTISSPMALATERELVNTQYIIAAAATNFGTIENSPWTDRPLTRLTILMGNQPVNLTCADNPLDIFDILERATA